MNGAAQWRRPGRIRQPWMRAALALGLLGYLLLALGSIEVDPERLAEGFSRASQFGAALISPDFTSRWQDLWQGLLESLAMTFVATALGVSLAIPVALGAARNLAARPVYLCCRGLIVASRSLQEIILAILFVAMFGFGPFAGVVTLALATLGFFAKLLAEEIEALDPAQAEAVRATGASWPQWINYGVQPQVMPRLIGLCLYRLDINFRESAIIGIVGGGGIGATLNTAFERYEFRTAAAILLLIIAMVLLAEYVSGLIRRWVQ